MKRITVVVPDRKGLIADLSEVLEKNGININTINAIEENGTAYIALEVDRYDDTLALLRDTEYQAVPEEVIVIRIEDQPGGLAKISRRLSENDINIRGMTMLQRSNGWCAVAVAVAPEDHDATRKVLTEEIMEV